MCAKSIEPSTYCAESTEFAAILATVTLESKIFAVVIASSATSDATTVPAAILAPVIAPSAIRAIGNVPEVKSLALVEPAAAQVLSPLRNVEVLAVPVADNIGISTAST